MYLDLLNNLAITATFLFIAGKFFQNRPLHITSSLKRRVFAGLVAGLVGSLLMISTIQVTETVIVDLRHLPIVVGAIFGGPVTAIISGFIIGLLRAFLFGISSASVIAGLIAVSMGVIIGFISTMKISKVVKYILMNSAYVMASAIFIYALVNNPSISIHALIFYIPISIIGGLFTYYMAEYIKRSNENHRSMQYFKLMAENSSDLISTHHLDGNFKYLSPSCKGILGYEANELIGENPYEYYHPEDLLNIQHSHQTIEGSKETSTVEYRFKHKDRTYVWLETTSRRMEDQTQSNHEIICISRNITERKIIEEALNESKERYGNLVKFMPDPMIVYKDEKIIFANEQASKLGKYTVTELLGRSIFEFIHPNDHAEISNALRELYELQKDQHMLAFQITTSTNRLLDIEATCKYITFNKEGAIQVIYRDVTDRKRLERELIETRDRFKFIMDNANDVICILEPTGEVRYISPASENVFGYNPKEFQGKNAFEYIHPEDVAEILSLIEQIQNSEIEYASITYRYVTKSQNYIWVETVAKAVRNGTNLESILVISRDVTTRKELSIALEETNKELQQLSLIDGLTEIPNRRYFNTMLEKEWNQQKENKQDLSLILLDIDFFKRFNDEYGHLEGDDCLIKVARTLKNTLVRPKDFVARYGGEEFAVILPETSEEETRRVAEKLRENIRNEHIPHIKSEVNDYVTISLGCTTIVPDDNHTLEELIDRADKSLYKAKENGRNRVSQYVS